MLVADEQDFKTKTENTQDYVKKIDNRKSPHSVIEEENDLQDSI